jgi:hypothetical protein
MESTANTPLNDETLNKYQTAAELTNRMHLYA